MTSSLFNNITSADVEDLIQEQILLKDKYKFSYIVDPHDISSYCYPFGLTVAKDGRNEKELNIIADEQIAYYSLFNSSYFFLILDEHIDELINFKNKIIYQKNIGIKVIDNLKILIKQYNELKNKKSFNFEILQDYKNIYKNISNYHISLFLSLSLGSLRDGMEKLNSLEQNRNLITNEDDVLSKLPYSNFVKNSLLNIKPTEFSDDIYIKIRQQIYAEKISLSKKLAYYRDCQAIDRITQFNNFIARDEKVIFLYLSSTNKSKELYKKTNRNLFVKINDKLFNPHRTISQEFLKIICKEDTRKGTIYNLEEIKNILDKRESYDSSKSTINDDNLYKFEERISTFRKRFENSSLLLQFDSRHLENVLIESLQNSSDLLESDLINNIQNILKLAEYKQEIKKIKRTTLKEITFERNFITTLINGIKRIESVDDKYIFDLSSGEDYVSNLHHHFPLVFFSKEPKLTEIVDSIVSFYLESKPNKRGSQKLILFINSSISIMLGKSSSDEEKIIRLLIYLMLPKNNQNNPETIAYDRVTEIIKKSSITPQELKEEFIYIASWIARRIKKYEESLKWAEKGLKLHKEDPRFFHSKTLANYCLYMDTKKIEYLDVSISNCLLSISYYKDINSNKLEIKKATIAVLNTLSYLYCLKYEQNQDKELIIKSRNAFNEVKELEKDYILFPEFLHTEAMLEFVEFSFENDLRKLFSAEKLIKKAIEYNDKQSYIILLRNIKQRLANNV